VRDAVDRDFTETDRDLLHIVTDLAAGAIRFGRLAHVAPALAQGVAAALAAQAAPRVLFGDSTLEELATSDSVPSVEIDRSRLDSGIQAVDLLVHAGLADSKGAAKRLIEQGGAYLNNERLSARLVTAGDLAQGVLLLRAGKKRYMRVVPGTT
jgi:tyrosyl-tRNA synthetase